MLYHLFYPLHTVYGSFRVFRYISFRVFMAVLTALVISFLLGPLLIRLLRHFQIAQQIRDEGPERHKAKSGTPTMGGILIILSFVGSFLLWAKLDLYLTWLVVFATLGFAVIGFIDDYIKLTRKHSKGLSIGGKLKMQLFVSIGISVALFWMPGFEPALTFPFVKDYVLVLGYGFIPFAILVVIGSSNAVNLTDGLDGLAIGPVLVAAFTYLLLSYIAGHSAISGYLQVTYVRNAGELAIFCAAMVGAGLGFLWFNTYPAQVFMGDVGSLALGAALGIVAIVAKQELLLVIVGGVFVVEAVSVLIQIVTFRTMGKRFFKMAPIHHHFELKGWAEPKIIVRFWIISIVLALVALATLKLR